MVKVEMITVGKELLIGKTVNTNAYWVGGIIANIGAMLNRITTINDDVNEISSTIREALARKPDFIIVVGGLGPTPDDITLKGIAVSLHRELRLNHDALNMIKQHYKASGVRRIRITQPRKKMAILPDGSIPLENKEGTAPGVRIEENSTIIFCLPGVPREMKSMFKQFVLPEIAKKVGGVHAISFTMNLIGIYESTLASLISRIMKRFPEAYIKSHPKGVKEGISRIEIHVIITSKNKEMAINQARIIANSLKKGISRLGGSITSIKGLG